MNTFPRSACMPWMKYRCPSSETDALVIRHIRSTTDLNSSEQVMVIRSVFFPWAIRGLLKSRFSCICFTYSPLGLSIPNSAKNLSALRALFFVRLHQGRIHKAHVFFGSFWNFIRPPSPFIVSWVTDVYGVCSSLVGPIHLF